MLSCAPGNLDRAPGQPDRAPGQPDRAPGQSGIPSFGSTRARARARAGTTGIGSAKSNENSVLTATDELRTYKRNLLGKSKRRILILSNGFNRAPGQLIAGTDTSVLPGNLRSIPDMIPCEANCFLFV